MSAEPSESATPATPGARSTCSVGRRKLSQFFPVPLSWKSILPFVALAAGWEIASFFSPRYLFPGLGAILTDVWHILTTWDLLYQGLVTWGRLICAGIASLILGIPIGLTMGMSTQADEFVRPIVKFIMGVPALNWVIIVIIWFQNTELRIGFVLLMLCTPITIFCIYDGVRSIDRKLIDMVSSFGASDIQHVRLLLWPYVKTFAFTAAKLNIANAIRTVIVAELVGASAGIGKELDLAKNVFDMAMVLAWTLIMVGMLLVMAKGIEGAERVVLRWRSETRARA